MCPRKCLATWSAASHLRSSSPAGVPKRTTWRSWGHWAACHRPTPWSAPWSTNRVIGASNNLAETGWSVETVPCRTDGRIDPEQLASMIRKDTRLACVQLANPVLGTIQPVREIAEAFATTGGCSFTAMRPRLLARSPSMLTSCRPTRSQSAATSSMAPREAGPCYIRRGLALARSPSVNHARWDSARRRKHPRLHRTGGRLGDGRPRCQRRRSQSFGAARASR